MNIRALLTDALAATAVLALSDNEWQLLQPCFPRPGTTGRPREHSHRELLNAMFYLVRTGCQWRIGPAFIHEHHLIGGHARQPLRPLLSLLHHVGPRLLAGVQRFFYNSTPAG